MLGLFRACLDNPYFLSSNPVCRLYVVLNNLLLSGHFSLRPEDFKRLRAHLIFAELAFLLQKVPALTQSTPLTLLCVIHHMYGAYCMHKETEIPESLTSVPIRVSTSSLRLVSQLGRWLGFSQFMLTRNRSRAVRLFFPSRQPCEMIG